MLSITDKIDLRSNLETDLNREVKPNELGNMETDALLLVRLALKKITDLENRIILLEKK